MRTATRTLLTGASLLAALMLCLLMPHLASGQEMPAGAQGRLTPQDLMSGPMPHSMPLWPSAAEGATRYANVDIINVNYATDAESAAAMVPAALRLVDIPELPGRAVVNLIFAKYRQVNTLGPYQEAVIAIPVLHEGKLYLYIPTIYVDSDTGMVAGRELGGFPKKLATFDMRQFGDLFLSSASRPRADLKTSDPSFSQLLSSAVTRGRRLVTIPLAASRTRRLPVPYDSLIPLPEATGEPQPYVIDTIGMRYIPGVGPGPDGAVGADLLQLIATTWVFAQGEIYQGLHPSIELFESDEDPIARLLPMRSILGAYIIRGNMQSDAREWKVIEDFTRRAAAESAQ